MSITTLENEIVHELRRLTGERRISKKWIMEWKTGRQDAPNLEPEEGETLTYVGSLGVWVAWKGPKEGSQNANKD